MNRRDLLTSGAAATFISGFSAAHAQQRPQRLQSPGVYIENRRRNFEITPLPTGITMFIGHFGAGLAAGARARISAPSEIPRGFAQALGLATAFFAAGGQTLLLVNAARRGDGFTDYETVLSEMDGQSGQDFNLLLLVGAEALYPRQTARLSILYETAIRVARNHYGMLLVEAPNVASGHQSWLADLSLNDPDVAAWGPHLQTPSGDTVAPGPTIAGIIADTDNRMGVWKAPAGLGTNIPGHQPALALNQAEIQDMGFSNINPIRATNGQTVIWGARTLSSDPEWKYIPVRRLSRWIERSVNTGIRWAVFEENNINTWTALRTQVEGFLNDIWRQGGLQGPISRQAYYVRCDHMTMTPLDIMNGLLRLELGFAPVRPAEFIVLRFELEIQQP